MLTSIDLFGKVRDYIDRRCSLTDLEAWIAPRLAHYFTSPESPVAQLVTLIELGLAEIGAGITTYRTGGGEQKAY